MASLVLIGMELVLMRLSLMPTRLYGFQPGIELALTRRIPLMEKNWSRTNKNRPTGSKTTTGNSIIDNKQSSKAVTTMNKNRNGKWGFISISSNYLNWTSAYKKQPGIETWNPYRKGWDQSKGKNGIYLKPYRIGNHLSWHLIEYIESLLSCSSSINLAVGPVWGEVNLNC